MRAAIHVACNIITVIMRFLRRVRKTVAYTVNLPVRPHVSTTEPLTYFDKIWSANVELLSHALSSKLFPKHCN
jgi:hypothetical protein